MSMYNPECPREQYAPLMLLLYINNIGRGISSEIRLFADDCLLYRKVFSPEDAFALQSDLDQLSIWGKDWQITFNPIKCYTFRVSKLTSLNVYNYHIAGNVLQSVNDHSYNGVYLSDNLRWNVHTVKICKKATNQLNFIKSNLSKHTSQVKPLAFKNL